MFFVFQTGTHPSKKRKYFKNKAGDIIVFSTRQKARNYCRNRFIADNLYIECKETGRAEKYITSTQAGLSNG